MRIRPKHLPNFELPPLDEVVIGVQFARPANYTSINAKDVWNLFKDKYPTVEEHPPLAPSFEMFGGSTTPSTFRLQLQPTPLISRLWFISKDRSHLIQFQTDRFLLNWRRQPQGSNYPHFESIADSFEKHFGALRDFFKDSISNNIIINQAEVSYINVIPIEKYTQAEEFFSFLTITNDSESFNFQTTEVIKDQDGKPYARLFQELQSVTTLDGKSRAFNLSLTFRGKPSGNEIADTVPFIFAGREKIVTRFTAATTNGAHSIWKQIK